MTGRELHTLRTELRTDTNEANSARSVAYSPDGRWLAVGNEDHIVRIWDAKTAEKLLELESHTKAVRAVAFSPDGQRLASGSDGLRLWRIWRMQ
jgi:WD40 repeat protein